MKLLALNSRTTVKLFKVTALHILLALVFSPSAVNAVEDPRDSLVRSYMRQGVEAYNSYDLQSAIEAFNMAYTTCEEDYNDPLYINTLKNYAGLLAITKRKGVFKKLVADNITRLPYQDCSPNMSNLVLGTLVNFHTGASYQEDIATASLVLKYTDIAFENCNHDSINLAQIYVNAAQLEINKGTCKRAKDYLEFSRQYLEQLGSLDNYAATLALTEAQYHTCSGKYELALKKVKNSSQLFLGSQQPNRSVEPLDWAIENLSPILDTNDLRYLIHRTLFLKDSLEINSNIDQTQLLDIIARVHEANASLHRKELVIYQMTIAFAFFFILFSVLFFIFFKRKNSYTLKNLDNTVKAYQENINARNSLTISNDFKDLLKNLLEDKAIGSAELERRILKDFGYLFENSTLYQNLSSGDRCVLYTLLLGASNAESANMLMTTVNSYRVRKSKFLKIKLQNCPATNIGQPLLRELLKPYLVRQLN